MMHLRDYQTCLIEDIRNRFRAADRSVLVQLATGGGKTVTSAFMVSNAAARGRRCLWVVHRREIIMQASRTFWEMEIPHGLIMGGRETEPGAMVQIGSIQTVARRLNRIGHFDLIIFDECHHMASAQYQALYDAYPSAQIVGLTATPWRLDGRGLGGWFQTMVQGPSVSDLMQRGALCDYRLYAPSTVDTSGVGTQAGDYKRNDLSAVMDKPTITGDAVLHYRRLASGKRAVVFAVSIDHSRHVVEQFNEAGIPAEHVDGQMDHASRDAAVARFVSGEGFDVPAIEAVILLRPTQSLSLHLQQIGRALRPAADKPHAIILDHAGNAMRHGLPDDDRDWNLDDRPKKKRGAKSETPVRQCPTCYRVHAPAPICPGCGHAYETAGRSVETVDGVLEAVDVEALRARKKVELKAARTMDDLIALGRSRQYRFPEKWAGHIMTQRVAWRQQRA